MSAEKILLQDHMEGDKEDDIALEKWFEDSTLILGDLAKRCFLEERGPPFSQEEVDKLEKARTNGRGVLAARVGLVFMEASVKKLNPEHENHFLHRTFSRVFSCCMLHTVNGRRH